MTDDPDGDRSDGPSDTSSEEDPFIYPYEDDDSQRGDESATAADTSTTDTGESATSADESATSADESTTGPDAPSTGAGPASSGAGTSSPRSGAPTTKSDSSRAPTDSRRSAYPNATSSSTEAGRHVTDRRPHASESGRSPPPRGRSGSGGSTSGGRSTGGAPARHRGRRSPTETGPSGLVGWARWFWTTEEGAAIYVRDVVTSVMAVLLVGLVLFGVSGIWPPMVAVESGSMEPNMQVGDLVFIVDNERYTPDEAQEYDGSSTGVVPADRATESGRTKFGGPGDVIVFKPNGNEGTTPVIHRAMMWVQEGENWYDRADPEAVGTANNCRELNHCPAPHAGFITRGDANPRYDQQTTLSEPVRPEWIVGTAELRIPFLGHIRLAFSGQVAPGTTSAAPVVPGTTSAAHSWANASESPPAVRAGAPSGQVARP